MRHTKMAEWMENVEKSISRIMADKVYTSAEFKRERDNFHVSLPRYYEKCTYTGGIQNISKGREGGGQKIVVLHLGYCNLLYLYFETTIQGLQSLSLRQEGMGTVYKVNFMNF